jgi:ribosomal protein S27AE
MTVRPDYGPEFGEEERREQRLAELREEHLLPVERDELVEEEIEESEQQERANLYVEDDNELHAPGQHCARCGRVIATGEDVRLRADGQWQHEECPVDLSELEPGQPGPAPG